ncbi:ATP12 family chaperone protein [Pseudooceanicola spongiae]|uniref:ATPase n=1 Tax=Pseudooceanicola spongiae TaxID=2613965 RepID=A0A7L9WSM2_9RHOB|nr:ATP12 family protein [Pseudooceanicola spongiae]QOL82874.1 ATPase [Pseudooceanicola spongiae]
MSEWKARRFWKAADVAEQGNGYTVLLDGREVKTPAKSPLILPSRALALQIASEWDAQDGVIDPLSMPHTRTANSAIDKVTPQHAEVADLLADYGDSDLLCYRAESPTELVERQQEAWDPMLDWAAQTLGARLHPRAGVIHQSQDPEAVAVLTRRVRDLSAFELAAFHDLVSLTGSLVLGFAAFLDAAPINRVWEISRIDETWQQEQWGVDDDAMDVAGRKSVAFQHAKHFADLTRAVS